LSRVLTIISRAEICEIAHPSASASRYSRAAGLPRENANQDIAVDQVRHVELLLSFVKEAFSPENRAEDC
jgi:hypothetical protein